MQSVEKFISTRKAYDYQVLTPKGWIDILWAGETIPFSQWTLKTDQGKEITCADTHILYKAQIISHDEKKCNLTETFCQEIQIGDFIMTKDGPEEVVEKTITIDRVNMYDLQIEEGSSHQYYTGDILSHNSLWMQNLSIKSADLGYNVLYITLEMSERKVMKRMGAMRLKIPINDYDRISKDTDFIRNRIKSLSNNSDGLSDSLFEKKVGKIITKFWAAGTSTVSDFDAFIQKLKDKRGIKIDMIIVDYITLVAPPKGIGGDSLYIRGKNIAEGLRALGAKWNCPVITGIQVAKDAWNSSDITLESVPESKAIAETADTFFAIIRTEEMKRMNIYRFKLLKQRDGDFLRSQIKINLNPQFLTLENDQFLDQ